MLECQKSDQQKDSGEVLQQRRFRSQSQPSAQNIRVKKAAFGSQATSRAFVQETRMDCLELRTGREHTLLCAKRARARSSEVPLREKLSRFVASCRAMSSKLCSNINPSRIGLAADSQDIRELSICSAQAEQRSSVCARGLMKCRAIAQSLMPKLICCRLPLLFFSNKFFSSLAVHHFLPFLCSAEQSLHGQWPKLAEVSKSPITLNKQAFFIYA